MSNGVKRAKHTHHWKPAAIVLDIEGTVAPISFVADVMFPHARDNVRAYLESHYNSAETRADIDAIRKQVCVQQAGRFAGGWVFGWLVCTETSLLAGHLAGWCALRLPC